MTLYRITSDSPERTIKVATRMLGQRSTFSSITVDGTDLLVEADEMPQLPAWLVVTEESV